MKRIISFPKWIFILFLGFAVQAQESQLPSVDIYTLEGERINANSIHNDGMPMLLVFFRTFERSSSENLFSIYEAYDEFLITKGVKMIAVCVDHIGKIEHIKPFVSGHGIDIQVYIDKNGDFKNAMGIPDAPFTILFDQDMNEYCRQLGYCVNNQDIVCQKVNECLKKIDTKP